MSFQTIVRFSDGGRMRLRLTGRGAFTSTLQRARWAATDALRADTDGLIDRVEIVGAQGVFETLRREPEPGHSSHEHEARGIT